jgi:uncharacterized phage protein (TIGR02220 family)
MQGWIKLHRGLIKWEWYDHLPTKVLFLHLLLIANHKDNNYRGKIVKRGSLLTSRDILASETGLTVRQIRTALTNLKTTNEIAIKSSAKGTEIQVVKYDSFQGEAIETTNKRPTNDQQTTTNKNVNNEKNDNKDNTLFIFNTISYLNKVSNKNFKPTCKTTIKLINALLKDKVTSAEFKKVIDFKNSKWKDDKKMMEYIQPSTLFANSKFHQYLDESENAPKVYPYNINGDNC